MGRLIRVAALVVAVLATMAAPARAANPAYIAAAVTWSGPDEQAKTITVTVHLTLTPACTPSQMAARAAIPRLGRECTVGPDVAAAIKQNIEKMWSGQTYRCYRLIVNVDVKVDEHPDPKALDRLVVRVDQSAPNIRSSVSSLGRTGSAWNSGAYEDRTFPTNTPGQLSTWAYPPQGAADVNLYAHEAGHVLGLEDGYLDVPDPTDPKKTISQPRAGAPADDLMTNQANSKVDPSTMNILIGRSGLFRSNPPRCDYKIDTMVSWYHFTALKCATPEGPWQLTLDGSNSIGAGVSLVLSGSGVVDLVTHADRHYSGHWEADFRVDVKGIPLSRGGQKGHVTGDATFDGTTLALVGTNATGDFWSQNPYAALGGAAANPAKDFQLPVTNDAYCPAP